MPVMLREPFQTLGVVWSPVPADFGKFVQYVVLYWDQSPLYQSGIAGNCSRMYFWIFDWICFCFTTFAGLTLLSASVSAHGFGPEDVNREKFAKVGVSAPGRGKGEW